jgi:hypothetical protein
MTDRALAERANDKARDWLDERRLSHTEHRKKLADMLQEFGAACANEALERAAQFIERDDPEAISKTLEDYAAEIRALKAEG